LPRRNEVKTGESALTAFESGVPVLGSGENLSLVTSAATRENVFELVVFLRFFVSLLFN
jgi:hypothetical protein